MHSNKIHQNHYGSFHTNEDLPVGKKRQFHESSSNVKFQQPRQSNGIDTRNQNRQYHHRESRYNSMSPNRNPRPVSLPSQNISNGRPRFAHGHNGNRNSSFKYGPMRDRISNRSSRSDGFPSRNNSKFKSNNPRVNMSYHIYNGIRNFGPGEEKKQIVYFSASFERDPVVNGDFITDILLRGMGKIEQSHCNPYYDRSANNSDIGKVNKGRENIDNVVYRLSNPQYSLLTNADKTPENWKDKIDRSDVCVFDVTPQCKERIPVIGIGVAETSRKYALEGRLRLIEHYGPNRHKNVWSPQQPHDNHFQYDDKSEQEEGKEKEKFDGPESEQGKEKENYLQTNHDYVIDIESQTDYDSESENDVVEEQQVKRLKPQNTGGLKDSGEEKVVADDIFPDFETYEFDEKTDSLMDNALSTQDIGTRNVERGRFYWKRKPVNEHDKKNYIDRMVDPRVMIELGYAIATKQPHQIVVVLNTAYGSMRDLPKFLFDIKPMFLTYMLSTTCDYYRYIESRDITNMTNKELYDRQQKQIHSITERVSVDMSYCLKKSLHNQLVRKKMQEVLDVIGTDRKEIKDRDCFTVFTTKQRYNQLLEIHRYFENHFGLCLFNNIDFIPYQKFVDNETEILLKKWAAGTLIGKQRQCHDLTRTESGIVVNFDKMLESCGKIRFGIHLHWNYYI